MKDDRSAESGEVRDQEMRVEEPHVHSDSFDHGDHSNPELEKFQSADELNCSSISIYKIMMSGHRVTRNRIKKEEQPSDVIGSKLRPADHGAAKRDKEEVPAPKEKEPKKMKKHAKS